jgi:hypothetical protein
MSLPNTKKDYTAMSIKDDPLPLSLGLSAAAWLVMVTTRPQ